MTVKDDIITDAQAKSGARDERSQMYQMNFTRNVRQVVGKNINDLHLDTIGGASLTTRAFEKFVAASFGGKNGSPTHINQVASQDINHFDQMVIGGASPVQSTSVSSSDSFAFGGPAGYTILLK